MCFKNINFYGFWMGDWRIFWRYIFSDSDCEPLVQQPSSRSQIANISRLGSRKNYESNDDESFGKLNSERDYRFFLNVDH